MKSVDRMLEKRSLGGAKKRASADTENPAKDIEKCYTSAVILEPPTSDLSENHHPMGTRSRQPSASTTPVAPPDSSSKSPEVNRPKATVGKPGIGSSNAKESYFTLTQKPLTDSVLQSSCSFVRSEKDQDKIKKLLERKAKLLIKKNRRKYKGLNTVKTRSSGSGNPGPSLASTAAGPLPKRKQSKYSKADVVDGVKMVLKENGEVIRIPVNSPTTPSKDSNTQSGTSVSASLDIALPALTTKTPASPKPKKSPVKKPAAVPKDEQDILLDLFFSNIEEGEAAVLEAERADRNNSGGSQQPSFSATNLSSDRERMESAAMEMAMSKDNYESAEDFGEMLSFEDIF